MAVRSAGERHWVTITRTCSIRITTKMFRVTLLVAVLAAALPRSASAECIRLGFGTVARAADAIFSGTVTSVGPPAITFAVDRAWKGPVTTPFTVYLPRSVERSGLLVAEGEKYLVLAFRASEKERMSIASDEARIFTVSPCGSGTIPWQQVSNQQVKGTRAREKSRASSLTARAQDGRHSYTRSLDNGSG